MSLVLVADSHVDALYGLRQMFEREAPGYQVVCFRTGRQATKFAMTTMPDVALADLRLCDMSGLRLLLQLKATAPSVITIMMSHCGGGQARCMCHEVGIDLFAEKPVDVGILLKNLRFLMTSKGGSR